MSQYFTPELEDLRVGFEMEFLKDPSKEEDQQEWILIKVKAGHLLPNNKGALQSIRVPYLTKEQIEAEGWTWIEPKENQKWKFLKFKKGDHEFFKYEDDQVMFVLYGKLSGKVFKGECKDINTFRYISKLLGI
jgi:hypothetical protein